MDEVQKDVLCVLLQELLDRGLISGDVCGTLFGSTSILTLSNTDVKLCAILYVAVIVLFITAYDKIFAVTFDENFAAAPGINVGLYNAAISIVCAVIIVLAMNLAGSLLTSALIVFPAISAMRIFKSFKKAKKYYPTYYYEKEGFWI